MYATQADLENAFGVNAVVVAADRDGDGAADAGVIAEALGNATALMDSYIGKKYALPLPSIPAVLVEKCVDIAMHRLSSATVLSDEIRERNKAALAWLRDLSSGRVSLGIDQSPPSAGGGVQISGNERRFTRDKLKGM